MTRSGPCVLPFIWVGTSSTDRGPSVYTSVPCDRNCGVVFIHGPHFPTFPPHQLRWCEHQSSARHLLKVHSSTRGLPVSIHPFLVTSDASSLVCPCHRTWVCGTPRKSHLFKETRFLSPPPFTPFIRVVQGQK